MAALAIHSFLTEKSLSVENSLINSRVGLRGNAEQNIRVLRKVIYEKAKREILQKQILPLFSFVQSM